MIRSFRYPLHPTAAQAETMERWLRFCCSLYNAALQHRRDAWVHEKRQRQLAEDRGEERKPQRGPSRFDQQKELVQLRAVDAEAAAVPSHVARSALQRLERTFEGFYRRVQSGAAPGYPRFRAARRYDSFSIAPRLREVGGVRGSRAARVRLGTLGWVRFHEYRPLRGTIREIAVRRDAGRWFVCFVCDLGEAPPKVVVSSAVGCDVGLKSFAAFSDGTSVDAPQFFRKAEATLARRQQALSRRKRGSNGKRRARLLVAKAHARIQSQRLNFARELAASTLAAYDLVAYEDLDIRRMAHGHFAKSIGDAAWGTFIHALTCKAESAGKYAIAVDPRGTTQACSACGARVPKDLSVRMHACSCGLVLDRDENAARNILALGRSVVSALASASPRPEGRTAATGGPADDKENRRD